MNKLITIVMPSYKSYGLVLSHVKKFSKKINFIIIENSFDKYLKKKIDQEFKNVEVYLQKNIGYGSAINYGAKFVKTKYFLAMNPDTKIELESIEKLIIAANKLKKFGAICPDHIDNTDKKKQKVEFIEQKSLYGAAILFSTKIFKKIRGFDENIFLYYEENDYFTKCNKLKLKLFLIKGTYFKHSLKGDSSSAKYKNQQEKFYSYLIGGWHGQWSKFYYIKKYEGYFTAIRKCLPNLFINILQLLINIFLNQKKAKYIYFKIEGLISSIFYLKSYKRSKFDYK